jgi:hypothetical protein
MEVSDAEETIDYDRSERPDVFIRACAIAFADTEFACGSVGFAERHHEV